MTPLETALALLEQGLWPIPVTAHDDPDSVNPGKAPIGYAWGVHRHTPQSLREVYELNPGAGVGAKLGPAGGVVDLDVDEPDLAAPVLERMFAGEPPVTLGWSSARGHHWLFRWDERFVAYGKAIVKDRVRYAGLEIRSGWSPEDKQYQTVVPPSLSADGRPRLWNGCKEIARLPDCFFRDLDEHFAAKPALKRLCPPKEKPRSVLLWDAERRASSYLDACDPAVSGRRGHDKTFAVACKVGPGFDLPPDVALRLILDGYNPRCDPPWSEKEIRHKVEDAYESPDNPPHGWLLGADRNRTPAKTGGGLNGDGHAEPEGDAGPDAGPEPDAAPEPEPAPEHPDDPHRLARLFLVGTSAGGFPTLRYWLEDWHQWDGSRYRVVPHAEIRARVVTHAKSEFDRVALEVDKPAMRVTSGIVTNVVQALSGLCLLTHAECPDRPAWLDHDDEEGASPGEIIPALNGLIHLPALVDGRRGLIPPTPRFFSPNCLGYDFDPSPPRPSHWLAFLESLWGDDPDSVQSLQEWFGYLLTPDTSQQKMLFLIGPPRSGKGTIARLLTALVGAANVAFPTLTSLANEFRVAPLIGRTLAIFPDARLNGRNDVPAIVERLLSISGEDAQTIDRKNKESWDGKLRTRFVLMANELPQLSDASGAITSRTVILRLTRTFAGREDRALEKKLAAELPSILLWSIAGWARLRRRGFFAQPETGRTLVKEMSDLTSPVSVFLSDACEVDPDAETAVADLYAAWKAWCSENGRDHAGHAAGLGRWIRAAVPQVETTQRRVAGKQTRFFRGIRLCEVPVAF